MPCLWLLLLSLSVCAASLTPSRICPALCPLSFSAPLSQDMVPKTVMCMLVNRVKDEIASDLVHNLYAQITSLESLLRGESPG